MGYRVDTIAPGHYYHICHRGVAQQDIFTSSDDKRRFQSILTYYLPRGLVTSYSLYQQSRVVKKHKHASPQLPSGIGLVDLLCYCLMSNHIHLLLRENVERGISKYVQRICNSYARYFNTRYHRHGALFAGRFKAVLIDGDEQLLHVTRYIHLNPYAAGMAEDPTKYQWTSLSEYISTGTPGICHTKLLRSMMKPNVYRAFVTDFADYARALEQIKHLTLD